MDSQRWWQPDQRTYQEWEGGAIEGEEIGKEDDEKKQKVERKERQKGETEEAGGAGRRGRGSGHEGKRASKRSQEEYQAEGIDLFNGKHDLAEADGRDLFARALLVEQEHRLRGGRR